jgi:tetratricopeptide (TPR) repeat protein
MASGKRRGGKKRSQKKRRDERQQEDAPLMLPFGDPRAMEKVSQDLGRLLAEREFGSIEEANAFLENMLREGGGRLPEAPAPTTPLEQAQDLIYEAFETESSRKRVQLAKKALKVSPDCADAYVLLAEESAKSLQEAKDLYEKGVQAGERALGEEAFEEEAGHFWGILETRPYMRAREGLATCLWELGEREEAIEHYREMLDLNPGDNQGIRYELAGWLLDEEMDEELGELLQRYEEDASAFWVYTRALWMFRKEGATKEATAALKEAIETNPYVPLYLLGHKSLPGALPELIGFGDESEAVAYFARALSAWLRTPGALEWLRQNVVGRLLAEIEEE